MDKEKAKLLLRSFRADGSDALNEDFREALQLAAKDRELGEWLAHERSEDAKFAYALSSLEIPNGLREEILAMLEFDGAPSEDGDELDALLIGSIGAVKPPLGLRDEILAAMEMEAKVHPIKAQSSKESSVWIKLSLAAVAAVVTVALFLNLNSEPANKELAQIAVGDATHELMSTLDHPENIKLVATNVSTDEGVNWLRNADLPIPQSMPNGLAEAKFLGCKDMQLSGGNPVSLLCFEKADLGRVYLIVVDIGDLKDASCLLAKDQISLKSCATCPNTHFNVVRWREGDKAYFLLTKAGKNDVVELF